MDQGESIGNNRDSSPDSGVSIFATVTVPPVVHTRLLFFFAFPVRIAST
jgi:hypothetical protein